MSPVTHIRSGWIAAFLSVCIWTGFIIITRLGGTGTLTSWGIAALRFGVGALIAVFFLPRILLPRLRVIMLFSLFGGIGYAIVVYAAFRLTPDACRSCFRIIAGRIAFFDGDYWVVVAWTETVKTTLHRAGHCVCRHRIDSRRLVFSRTTTHQRANSW